jgi:hypothetical protein
MLGSTTIPILLLTIVLTQSPSVPQPNEQCEAARSRNRFEEIWGKPVECVFGTEHVCYRKNGISFSAHFDSSNRAETIFMLSDMGISQLTKSIDRLVPKDDRGKCLKCQVSVSTSCQNTYVEEYECLTIEYFEESCADLNLASVKIKWK